MQILPAVGDIKLFSGLAASRGRLAVAALVLIALSIGYGRLVGGWVETTSTSVISNLFLITFQFFFVLAAAWVCAMLAGSILFGDEWRRRSLLGEKRNVVDETEVLIDQYRDNSLAFYGLVFLMIAMNYGVVVGACDNYIKRYGESGYFRTLMRSYSADDRIRGIRGAVSPVRGADHANAEIRDQIAGLLTDTTPEVQAWAAWGAGHMNLAAARPALMTLLETGDDPTRKEAAIALGRINDRVSDRRLAELVVPTFGNDEVMEGLLVGIGFSGVVEAAPQITTMFGLLSEDLEELALWALARSEATCVHDVVMQRLDADDIDIVCAAADAMKYLATTEDEAELRRRFRELDEDIVCEEVKWRGRRYSRRNPVTGTVIVQYERLREKYLDAVFNIAGNNLQAWLARIYEDTEEIPQLRNHANDLLTELRRTPSRVPRRPGSCGEIE